MSLHRMMEIAFGSAPVATFKMSDPPTLAELAERCARAEALLARIGGARGDFVCDSGGPRIGVESHEIVEGWIRHYFDGSYYGDMKVSSSDPVLRRLIEGA